MKKTGRITIWFPLLAFILFALCMFIIGIGFYRMQVKDWRAENLEMLSAIAELKIMQIVQWRADQLDDVQMLANDPYFSRSVRNALASESTTYSDSEILSTLQRARTTYGLRDMMVLDSGGIRRFAAKADDWFMPDHETCLRALQTGLPVWGDFVRHAPSGAISLDLMIPLQNGVLVACIDPQESLFPLVQSWPTRSGSAETLLIRRDGDEILYLNELRHRKNTALQLRVSLQESQMPSVQAALGGLVQTAGVDYRGKNVIYTAKEIPGTPWLMIAKIDEAEILGRLRLPGFAAACIFMLSMAAVGIYMYRHLNLRRTMDKRLVEDLDKATRDLNLRIRELNCLYGMTAAAEGHEHLDGILNKIVNILPQAWEYPEVTCARILLEGKLYATTPCSQTQWGQSADIVMQGLSLGKVEIFYLEDRTAAKETVDPLHPRSFINEVAERISLTVQRISARTDLQESLARLNTIMDCSPAGIFLTDEKGECVFTNRKWCEMSGLSPDDARGQGWSSGIHPDDRAAVREKWLAFVTAEGHFGHEYRLLDKRGKAIWVFGTAQAICNEDGACTGYVGINTDITQRKLAEEQTHMNEARLEALYILSSMTQADEHALSSYALEEGVRLTGSSIGYLHFVHDDQESINLNAWSRDTLRHCKAEKTTHYPLEKAGVWADCIRQKKPVVHNEYQSLTDRKGYPEGHSPILRHLSVPVFDNDKIVAVAGVGNKKEPYDESDIRQLSIFMNDMWKQLARRRAEENVRQINAELEKKVAQRTAQLQLTLDTLRRSEDRYRTVADFTFDWEFWISPERNYLYVSPSFERITGYPAQSLLDDFNFLENIVHPEDLPLIIPHMKENQHTDDMPIDFRIITREGEERWVSHLCQRIFSSDGRFLGMRGSNRDITETKRLRDEAIRDAHLASVGRLAAGMAHEINNPISGVINYAQIIRRKCALDDKYREYLDDLISEAERVATIVKDLLLFSRPHFGDSAPSDLQEIYSRTFSLFAKQFQNHFVLVSALFPGHLPRVRARQQQIQQVMLNIFSNALYALNKKYPDADPEKIFQITAEKISGDGAGLVRVTFHDSGTGIPADIVARVCDPFFSTKPAGDGTGLGLSISYTILKEHGGSIRIDSRDGEYTKIIMELPAMEEII